MNLNIKIIILSLNFKIINKISEKYKLSFLSKLVLSKEKKTQNIL